MMSATPGNLNKHHAPLISKTPTQIARQLHLQYETDAGSFFAEIAKFPLENLCKILIELPSNNFNLKSTHFSSSVISYG